MKISLFRGHAWDCAWMGVDISDTDISLQIQPYSEQNMGGKAHQYLFEMPLVCQIFFKVTI